MFTVIPVSIRLSVRLLAISCTEACADPEGGPGGQDPPEKSQKM